jgi:penicillin-binding protein 1A
MTVRLAQDVGMPLIAEYAGASASTTICRPFLSLSLGAGETTVLRMVGRLFDVRQRRQTDQADLDRPHPGPLRPDRLPARRARMPRLHGADKWEQPARSRR